MIGFGAMMESGCPLGNGDLAISRVGLGHS
jgi:hypothetical protein